MLQHADATTAGLSILISQALPRRHVMLRKLCLAAAILSVFCALFPMPADAQQGPIALPNTVSTVGGGATAAFTIGASYGAGSSLTATDTLGDGCPATSAFF